MAKKWHKKHISTKWGVIVLGILLLAVAVLIPYLKQQQKLEGNAWYSLNEIGDRAICYEKKTCPKSTDKNYNFRLIGNNCVRYKIMKDPEAIGGLECWESPVNRCTGRSIGTRHFPHCLSTYHIDLSGSTPKCVHNKIVPCKK